MNKGNKILFYGLLILIIGFILFFYQTHKSVDKERDVIDLNILDGNTINLKSGVFDSNAIGSDLFHKGSGEVFITETSDGNRLVLGDDFEITNAPDLKIYLVRDINIDNVDKFLSVKSDSLLVDSLYQFSGYSSYDISSSVVVSDYRGVVIWCEKFSKFMSYANLE
ncbi:MAG: DM13 domain-containing protein [Nanoarchaeales archaeon]|nr:DM13 domain-containing protein [Nanoarchaeales archaeon]